MKKESDDLFVLQQEDEDNLVLRLRKQALEAYQRLSGKVWTDFNVHDPGITITEVLHYALTELDYRLRFPWQDYLTGPDGTFRPEEFGLFYPSSIFPVSPVTPDDYRKYLLGRLPDIENVWIETAEDQPDRYVFYVEPALFGQAPPEREIRREIRQLYYNSRNLCEELEEIRFIRRQELFLSGDIYTEQGIDGTGLLAEIYWTVQAYLAGYPRYLYPEDIPKEEYSPEAWFDGPLDNGMKIIFPSYTSLPTETELYLKLRQLPGVKALLSFHLEDEEGGIVNTFDRFYSIALPATEKELKIRLFTGRTEVKIQRQELLSKIRTCYFRYKGTRQSEGRRQPADETPDGTYRSFGHHDSVQDDFPPVYGIGTDGLRAGTDDLRKAQAKQLKAYLLLFDLSLACGLCELDELRLLMRQKNTFPSGSVPPLTDPVYQWEQLADPDSATAWKSRSTTDQKERLLDFWDKLYGEESNPAWLQEFNVYEETREEAIGRRILFLQQVPQWGRDRFRAAQPGKRHRAGIEQYMAALLGWQHEEGHAAGNLFSLYNLMLVEDAVYFEATGAGSGPFLIHDYQIRSCREECVPYREIGYPAIHYLKLRRELPFLHPGLLFGSLFREGIRIENYKIIFIGREEHYVLVFRSKWLSYRISLGRFADKEKCIEAANRLRCFLRWLNLRSETMYLVEHQYFRTPEPFTLTVVFPGWSARMHDIRFRGACEEWLVARLPAHIRIHFRWFDIETLWKFENYRNNWLHCHTRGYRENAWTYMDKIQEIIT